MEKIKLNFVPLSNQENSFVVYRKLIEDTSSPKDPSLYRTKLPKNENSDERLIYDVSLSSSDGLDEFTCNYRVNAVLSEYYLFEELKSGLNKNQGNLNYSVPQNSKYKEVTFTIEKKSRGNIQILVHPYYLRSKKLLGFLLQSKFSLNDDSKFDRVVQIESMSLDKNGRPNVFLFRDKERLIIDFLHHDFTELCNQSNFSINNNLSIVETRELDRKSYLVGKSQASQSQFMGVKNSGPYKHLDENTRYLFVFSERTRSLGRDVYLGLTGKLFPAQFPGLNRMFNLDIRKDLVDHYSLQNFTKESIDQLSSFIAEQKEKHSDNKMIMIVTLPKGFKGVESVFDAYGYLKLISLQHGVYCQFVTEDTFYKKDILKWSISNIGLQIFSKLGGTPWLVKPAKSKCLILGLGSSHEMIDGEIKKWFAYTVCLDSSGNFKYIKPLSSSNEEESYIEKFKTSLRDIVLGEITNHYQSFVLHLPFKIKRSEVDAIKELIEKINQEYECELIVIRINTMHKYNGFSNHNTRVPYESSYVRLSNNTFLLWPEGLQHGKEVLHNRVSDPLLIDFIEEPESWDAKKDCLQDILNLTGANWRGFNSKAQPISILYSKLIADFMKEFSHLEGVNDLSMVEAESVAPWFL